MSNTNFVDMIEDYLDDRLSEDDKMRFIDELMVNQELQEELRKHQLAYSVIEVGIEDSLRSKLEELKQKEDHSSKQQKDDLTKRIIWMILVFIVIFILFLIFK